MNLNKTDSDGNLKERKIKNSIKRLIREVNSGSKRAEKRLLQRSEYRLQRNLRLKQNPTLPPQGDYEIIQAKTMGEKSLFTA